MLAWLATAALAGAPVLPGGSTTLYGGLGLTTWQTGMLIDARDRAAITRLDTFAAHGLSDRWTLEASLPLVHARVLVDRPELGPCPRSDGYCDPITSVGDARLLLRWGGEAGRAWATVGAGPRADLWNAGSRGRWINVGQGTVGAVLTGEAGLDLAVVPKLGATWIAELGRPVDGLDFRVPADTVAGRAALGGALGAVWIEGALEGSRRLRGVHGGPAWVASWQGPDQWAVLAFAQVRAAAKLSLALSDRTGVHLAGSRALWTQDGPRDLTDLSLGVHHWLPSDREGRP